MISVRFVDEIINIEKNSTLAELLVKQNYQNNGTIIALNRKFIPASLYDTTCLQENDLIEIIIPMQGG